MRNVLGFFGVLFIVVVACDGNDPGESALVKFNRQLGIDSVLIDTYLQANGIVALRDTSGSGVRYVIHEEGSGKSPKYNGSATPGDCFETDYLGKLLTGVSFDSADGFRTSLSSGIIQGWKIGFRYLQEGDSATIYIPSVFAYGKQGSGSKIPANSNLLFRVRLRKVVTPEYNPANDSYTCYYDDFIE